MTPIIFRRHPAVAAVERQLDLQFRDRLLDDDLEELPHLIDDASVELFGITRRDTLYWALPNSVRAKFSRSSWEENFEILGHYTRDPNAHWRGCTASKCSDGSWSARFTDFTRKPCSPSPVARPLRLRRPAPACTNAASSACSQPFSPRVRKTLSYLDFS